MREEKIETSKIKSGGTTTPHRLLPDGKYYDSVARSVPSLHYGKFAISKLPNTQGLTIANALRRILLYEIPAVGLESVEIFSLDSLKESSDLRKLFVGSSRAGYGRGVAGRSHPSPALSRPRETTAGYKDSPALALRPFHEYSKIPGMLESILELKINLESIIFKIDSFEEPLAPVIDRASRPQPANLDSAVIDSARQGEATPRPEPANGQGSKPTSRIAPRDRGREALPLAGLVGEELQGPGTRIAGYGREAQSLQQKAQVFINLESEDAKRDCYADIGSMRTETPPEQKAKPKPLASIPIKSFILRAKDLKLPKNISVVYPEQYIATFLETDDFLISGGYYFESLIQTYEGLGSPGLNSKIFPIKKVNYTIESSPLKTDLFQISEDSSSSRDRSRAASPSRAELLAGLQVRGRSAMDEGEAARNLDSAHLGLSRHPRKEYSEEQIILEIWTNGAICPEKALKYAIQYGVNLFQKFLF